MEKREDRNLVDFVEKKTASAIFCLFDCRFQITDLGGHIAFSGWASPWTVPEVPIHFHSPTVCILPKEVLECYRSLLTFQLTDFVLSRSSSLRFREHFSAQVNQNVL